MPPDISWCSRNAVYCITSWQDTRVVCEEHVMITLTDMTPVAPVTVFLLLHDQPCGFDAGQVALSWLGI